MVSKEDYSGLNNKCSFHPLGYSVEAMIDLVLRSSAT